MRGRVTVVDRRDTRFGHTRLDETASAKFRMRDDAEQVLATISEGSPNSEPPILINVDSVGLEYAGQTRGQGERESDDVTRVNDAGFISPCVQYVENVSDTFEQRTIDASRP